jgi:DNA-binding CsgD family transcriptional regulator
MKTDFESLFTVESFLKRFDLIFGGYTVMQVWIAWSSYSGQGEMISVISIACFFVFNMSTSIVSYFSTRATIIENYRILFGLVVTPLVFYFQSPGFLPWWPGYYIMTLGGVSFICLTYRRKLYGKLLILFYSCSAVIISKFILKVEWTTVISETGLYLVVSLSYFLILSLIQNSVSVVIELEQAKANLIHLQEENLRLKHLELVKQIETKDKELTVYSLNFIEKNKLIEDIKNEFYDLKINKLGDSGRKIDGITKKLEDSFKIDRDWDEFKNYYEGIHKNFFKILKENYPELTSTDLKLCALIKLNLNSKEIARILGVLPESIKTGRYRIRKKLKLKQSDNLFDFLNNVIASTNSNLA